MLSFHLNWVEGSLTESFRTVGEEYLYRPGEPAVEEARASKDWRLFSALCFSETRTTWCPAGAATNWRSTVLPAKECRRHRVRWQNDRWCYQETGHEGGIRRRRGQRLRECIVVCKARFVCVRHLPCVLSDVSSAWLQFLPFFHVPVFHWHPGLCGFKFYSTLVLDVAVVIGKWNWADSVDNKLKVCNVILMEKLYQLWRWLAETICPRLCAVNQLQSRFISLNGFRQNFCIFLAY